ncbi:MAG: hypothetical protein AAEJ52_19480 [Myxococcota bacterium]
MLSDLDDYPIHQSPEPLAHPVTGDRNFYDRYFFNGFSRDGELFFAAAMGLYPNRSVMDAAFSVVRGGEQYSLHASRLAPTERTETRVGPISLEVLEPMRRFRLSVTPGDSDLSCELLFDARTAALEEPRFTVQHHGRVSMDSTRFAQFGDWSGWVRVGSETIDVQSNQVPGVRDRSWGIRQVGEREIGAPGPAPQFFWLWAPLHFDDVCTHFGVNEYADGQIWHSNGVVAPRYSSADLIPKGVDPDVVRTPDAKHRIRWEPGTRRAASAEIEIVPHGQIPRQISLEPMLTFQMLGIGYLNPKWGHGLWKGDLAVGAERWKLDELDVLELQHIHIQQLCKARMGDREGIGVLEQLVIGPHGPSGFESLLDGAR